MDKGAHFVKCDFQVHTPRDANWDGAEAVTPAERKAYAEALVQVQKAWVRSLSPIITILRSSLLHQSRGCGRGGCNRPSNWDLQRMELDGWHPREIPESLLKGSALQKQQTFTLPPIEQWYLSLLQDGRVPGALINNDPTKKKKISRPNTAYTKSLREDARQRFPRLYDLSDNTIEDFMTDESWPKAEKKYRDNKNNGWSFLPLNESRQAWDKRYGQQQWNEMTEWDTGLKPWEED
jgi:hypothetical protein